MWARVSSYDHQILRPSRSGDDKAVWLGSELGVENLRRRVDSSRGRCPRVVAHADAVGGWIPGLWSRYVVERVYLVSFIRQRLDVHRSDKLSHSLLGLRIWT